MTVNQKVNGSTVELRMELAQVMIDSWSREDLITFAWDRLVDELGELNSLALDNICEQFDVESPNYEEKPSPVYEKDDPRSITDQFYDNPYNSNPE
jgi:hypothetical protein